MVNIDLINHLSDFIIITRDDGRLSANLLSRGLCECRHCQDADGRSPQTT